MPEVEGQARLSGHEEDKHMARDQQGEGGNAPDAFLAECQVLWQKAMALAGDAYAAQREELEQRLAEATEETRKLREQVDPLVHTRESQARSLVDLDRQLKTLQSTLNQEREENAGMREQYAARERELKEALESQARVDAKLREAEAETLAATEKAAAAQKRLKELEENFQGSVNQAVADVQSQLNKVSSKLEVITAERDRLNRDLADAFETITMLEERSKQAGARAQPSGALEQKIRDLESEIGALKRKNERLNAECDEFAQKNAELLKRLNSAAAV